MKDVTSFGKLLLVKQAVTLLQFRNRGERGPAGSGGDTQSEIRKTSAPVGRPRKTRIIERTLEESRQEAGLSRHGLAIARIGKEDPFFGRESLRKNQQMGQGA